MEKFSHYFIDKEHKKEDFFYINEKFNELNIKLKSCDNVFSKNEIDYGTKVLINAIIKNFDLNNKNCLDLGCGLGVVSIILSKYFEKTNFVLSDITKIATILSKENLKINGCQNFDVVNSDLFDEIKDSFDFVITNPPIRTGKKVLLKLIEDSKTHLNLGGKLVLVIRKSHGEESVKKYMESIFSNVEIIKRDKGFYVLVGENGNN